MSNDEARMTKEARNPNDEKRGFRDSGFVILSSLGLRHSSFTDVAKIVCALGHNASTYRTDFWPSTFN